MTDGSASRTPQDDGAFDVIFSYTRAQALEDGVLVDLTPWAKELGFRVPVACTSAVWHGLISPPPRARPLGQSERGRAHDVLFVLHHAIRGIRRSGDATEVRFTVRFLMGGEVYKDEELKCLCGPGDDFEPVLTILLPGED